MHGGIGIPLIHQLINSGGGLLPQLDSPSPLIASNETSTTIDLSWSDVSADNYILQRATQSDFSDAVQIYSGASTSFGDTGLDSLTTYYYRVKSQKTGYSDSEYSSTSTSTLSNWILATGLWDDNAVWDDNEVWRDN